MQEGGCLSDGLGGTVAGRLGEGRVDIEIFPLAGIGIGADDGDWKGRYFPDRLDEFVES